MHAHAPVCLLVLAHSGRPCLTKYTHARTHTHTHTHEHARAHTRTQGWDEALLSMKVGGRRILVIPVPPSSSLSSSLPRPPACSASSPYQSLSLPLFALPLSPSLPDPPGRAHSLVVHRCRRRLMSDTRRLSLYLSTSLPHPRVRAGCSPTSPMEPRVWAPSRQTPTSSFTWSSCPSAHEQSVA